MEHLGLNEIRERYLSFFQSQDHLRLPSFSLIPENDKSLLLIPAGMAPLKPYFMGEQTPPSKRVTTCQKCIRTNDIDNVGYTARHLTFFEMLGNFSFGDYFKPDATKWAWQFVTEVLGMPKERLWVSIYELDEESRDIWTKHVGVDPDHIFTMGKKDNFWEIGTGAGPCGPCSEIYFDRGEQYGCGSPDCKPGCDCDRYVEFWNLVFTQFNNDGNNNYIPLEHKNIDTGMGLERIACIMQEVGSVFEIDTMVAITDRVCEMAGVKRGMNAKTDVSLRIITDHIRSTVMMVCDGVHPSNEGRGYVLRRLLRRAARHGKLLGIEGAFLTDLADVVFAVSGEAYPQIIEKKDFIKKVIKIEEDNFSRTINAGLKILADEIEALKAAGGKVLAGEVAFKLSDTYGFPVDLTTEILSEQDMTVDMDAFKAELNAQKERARAARNKQGGLGWTGASTDLDASLTTAFTGYGSLIGAGKVTAILADGEQVPGLSGGEATILLDSTSFYAESGGQIGDAGTLTTEAGAVFAVSDVKKTPDNKFLHIGVLKNGTISLGDTVKTEVCASRRAAIARAHSSVHLLQAALREVLGAHVEQAGSNVEPDRARFDFNHFQAMTAEEIAKVEAIVNEKILAGIPGVTKEMSLADAKAAGAMALFGEKYGDTVRVVSFGDYSIELCGGTHLDNSAKVGLFKIVGESSVAAGVRRIEAVTGAGVLALLASKQEVIDTAAAALKTTGLELSRRAEQVAGEMKTMSREIESLKAEIAKGQTAALESKIEDVKGVSALFAQIDGMPTDQLRNMVDMLLNKADVVVLAGAVDGKVAFAAGATKATVGKGAHAGNILKAAAKVAQGGGGGRPDSATAGGKEVTKVAAALAEAKNALEGMIK